MVQRIITLFMMLLMAGAIAYSDTTIVFDKPLENANVDIMKAFKNRKSERSYTSQLISIHHLSTVLWSGYGINRQDGKHTVPTAYGKNYMRLYVIYDGKAYRYLPEKHCLQFIQAEVTTAMASTQGWVGKSTCVIVIVADMDGFPFYAGLQEQQLKYSYATAGCIAQNIYIACTGLKLGTCLVAGVNVTGCKKAFKLHEKELPLCIMPVGYPAAHQHSI
ncbi:MAG TPA: nitroreductase family protein [Spirochaetota bacterium]|nr:nitroreductase family protein [Spirochaetota bacterium]